MNLAPLMASLPVDLGQRIPNNQEPRRPRPTRGRYRDPFFERIQRLHPVLLRLPTAILGGHELLDTVSIGTHDYQNSLASLIAPEVEVHPVGPEIRVAPSREIPLKPPGMILTPVVLQGLTAPRESPLESVSGGRTLGTRTLTGPMPV